MSHLWQETFSTANQLNLSVGKPAEYARFKRLLNVGKHPTFVGLEMVARNAQNGGLWFAVDHIGVDVAAALVDPHYSNLLVMCVHPQARGRGIGKYLVRFLAPNYVRALESAEPFFSALGYEALGEYFQGRRLRTRILVRTDILRLAGRLRLAWQPAETSDAPSVDPAPHSTGPAALGALVTVDPAVLDE